MNLLPQKRSNLRGHADSSPVVVPGLGDQGGPPHPGDPFTCPRCSSRIFTAEEAVYHALLAAGGSICTPLEPLGIHTSRLCSSCAGVLPAHYDWCLRG